MGKKDKKTSQTAMSTSVDTNLEEACVVLDDIEIDKEYKIYFSDKYIFFLADNTLFLFDKPTKETVEKMKKEKETIKKANDNGNFETKSILDSEDSDDTEQTSPEETEDTQEVEDKTVDENLHIQPKKIENVSKIFIHENNYYYIDNSRKIFVFHKNDFHPYDITVPKTINVPLFEETKTVAKREARAINRWYNGFAERIAKSINTGATEEDKKNFPRWLEFKNHVKNDGYKNYLPNRNFSHFNEWNEKFYNKEYEKYNSNKREAIRSFDAKWGVEPTGEYRSIEFPDIIEVNYSGKNKDMIQLVRVYNDLVGIYKDYILKKNVSNSTRDIFDSTYKAIILEIKEIEKTERPVFVQEKAKYNDRMKELDGIFSQNVKDSLESIQFEYTGQNSDDYVFLPLYEDIPAYLITNDQKSATDSTIPYENEDIYIDLPGLDAVKLLIPKKIPRSEP
jgi:hypothetical protein